MVACTHVEKQTRYATPDMILVEAPGLPYTKSVYAAGPEFLSFFAEYLELVKVAKPVMQVFPITSERCITKVCLFEFLEHFLDSCSMYVPRSSMHIRPFVQPANLGQSMSSRKHG